MGQTGLVSCMAVFYACIIYKDSYLILLLNIMYISTFTQLIISRYASIYNGMSWVRQARLASSMALVNNTIDMLGFSHNTLQWHHMIVMTSVITDSFTVCSTASVRQQTKHQSSALLSLLWGESTSHWWIPLTKEPVMQKSFPRSAWLSLCDGDPPVPSGFPSPRANNAEIIAMV